MIKLMREILVLFRSYALFGLSLALGGALCATYAILAGREPPIWLAVVFIAPFAVIAAKMWYLSQAWSQREVTEVFAPDPRVTGTVEVITAGRPGLATLAFDQHGTVRVFISPSRLGEHSLIWSSPESASRGSPVVLFPPTRTTRVTAQAIRFEQTKGQLCLTS